ncbi:uncharacterized protein LOC142100153 [Mixophyes fleayi]|uniref:uncharacterized protein LOC142100153 n=1 Tax=Mixophyes fleayi TaxID=3061075 RepID=UPI003F4DC356
MALFNMFGYRFQASGTRSENASFYSPKESCTGRAHRGKLSKSDISSPSDFKHVTHVGFNSIPGLDAGSDVDVKTLFHLAGVKEEHLRDQELSRMLFDVIEKEGGMEALRRQTRRMTSVERHSPRTRLRSLSSSSLTPSKRQYFSVKSSPHKAIRAGDSPVVYFPALSKTPSPFPTPPPFKAPLPPIPPYLGELSQTFSSGSKPHVRPRSKKVPPSPQSLLSRTSMKVSPPPLPMSKPSSSETASYPLPSIPNHDTKVSEIAAVPPPPPPLPTFTKKTPSDTFNTIPAPFPSSIPNNEPPTKLGDVPPAPPPLPQFAKYLNSAGIPPSLSSEYLPNTNLLSVAVPPLPFKKPFSSSKMASLLSSETPLFNGSEPPSISEAKEITFNPACRSWGAVASNKDLDQQKNPTLFLDQIKQGMQLKSVTQAVKVESAECSNIVAALMDVIQRRNKAIHSSGT